ncbi:ABC transporter ATP-binding protein [Microbacterium sp. A84]|uniref:ABC transporter ATP-binding protein n=1 Tax=Microbacterium sp. A84 TaxID=3450715 RepID=UPI003F426D12
MIRAQSLTKRYRDKAAVNGISFTIEPGKVTGFLGPNGAGKSTTMRMMVGLDKPTSGSVEFAGRRYQDLPAPLREVGTLLDAGAAHKRRTAYKHLLAIASTHGISAQRVHEVMEIAGIESVAGKKVGGFSLGMRQRLGIASALLGDPGTIILDEPVNGLDPEGILWIRALLRRLAEEGRTVLLSSHLMSEMMQTADHLIVMGRGQILADGPIREVVADSTQSVVRVRTRDIRRLTTLLTLPDITVTPTPDGAAEITGLSAELVADAASAAGIVLHEIVTVEGSLEDAYLALTAEAIEYRSTTTGNGTSR